MRPVVHAEDLDDLRRASMAYAVVAAWSGAGLFDALSGGGPKLASELPAAERAISTTAPILLHLGLLRREGERWALSRAGRRLHEDGALTLSGAEAAVGDLSRIDPVMAHGGNVRAADGRSRTTEGGVREDDPEGARAFMAYLYDRADHPSRAVAEALLRRLAGVGRPEVLDLGGGHGRYARALADRGAAASLFDRPFVVRLARERHGDALRYVEGDFLAGDDLGGPYDAVLMSNIVHALGPDENLSVLRLAAAHLRPGGVLMVKDMFLDDLGAHPEEAAVFGLTMLMYTRQGRSWSLAEMAALCDAAGFGPLETELFPDDRFTLATSRRR